MNVRRRENIDRIFLGLLGVLVLVGIWALASASQPAAMQRFGDNNYFVKKRIVTQ